MKRGQDGVGLALPVLASLVLVGAGGIGAGVALVSAWLRGQAAQADDGAAGEDPAPFEHQDLTMSASGLVTGVLGTS